MNPSRILSSRRMMQYVGNVSSFTAYASCFSIGTYMCFVTYTLSLKNEEEDTTRRENRRNPEVRIVGPKEDLECWIRNEKSYKVMEIVLGDLHAQREITSEPIGSNDPRLVENEKLPKIMESIRNGEYEIDHEDKICKIDDNLAFPLYYMGNWEAEVKPVNGMDYLIYFGHVSLLSVIPALIGRYRGIKLWKKSISKQGIDKFASAIEKRPTSEGSLFMLNVAVQTVVITATCLVIPAVYYSHWSKYPFQLYFGESTDEWPKRPFFDLFLLHSLQVPVLIALIAVTGLLCTCMSFMPFSVVGGSMMMSSIRHRLLRLRRTRPVHKSPTTTEL